MIKDNIQPRILGEIKIEHISDTYKRLTYLMTDEDKFSRDEIKLQFPYPGFKNIYFVKAIDKKEDVETQLIWRAEPLTREVTFYSPNFAHKACINLNHTIDYVPAREQYDTIIIEYNVY